MFYGLDAHKRFVQICEIGPGGERRRDFRIAATAEEIAKFARTLGPDDSVVLEASFHTRAIWALLVPHAGRVVVANPMQVKAIAHARVKTDKVDAHILAQLLRLDFIPEVAMVDEETWALRQLVSCQRFLGKQRVALRNRIRSLLNARLWHCPFIDLFGAAGRRWLKSQPFSEEERMILETTLELHDALQRQMEFVETALRQRAGQRLEAKLLMTIPGVNVTVAIGLVAAIGEIQRFPTPGQLSSYFGLVTRIHQSAEKCYHGQITKAGRSHGRWLAIEAAQTLAQSTSPLAATYHRIRRKKGHNVAVTALARKLIVLVWHMLSNSEPYRYAPVTRTRQKLRRVTPGIGSAAKGQVPRTLEAVYAEAGLPQPTLPTAWERRMKARNQRTVTMARRTPPSECEGMGAMVGPTPAHARRTDQR